MLSLITLFSASIACCPLMKSFRTRPSTTWKVTPITGSTASTASPSFQLIESSSTLAPRIRKTDDTSDPTACDTNSFTASTSEVRFVSSFAVVTRWMNARSCVASFATSCVRRSRATRSDANVCAMLCR